MSNTDRLIELLHEAKARPVGAGRDRFLDEACQGDTALRDQIVSLLEADAKNRNPDFLEHTLLFRHEALITEKPGDRIGRYKLLQQLGEGGCGVVYMAEQEEPVRRRVALKVIKLGMDTKSVIARFEAERQALALMDHPNIAKVFDAGATEAGRPFFVMELVRGIKITDYCDQNNLTTEQRLELFTQVCHAVQHAHQKGIIHRDLKPSNILVTLHDGVPVPKVIDFGIAKATSDQRLTDKTVFTAFEQFIGTPAYMSPEQAEMSGLDIDTRSDIYSLGVLLYELLTGNTPLDADELRHAGVEEMRRKIREDEPQRPSTRLSTMQAADLSTVAKHRQADAPKLVHLVHGDLDWIVMKCLEKDRTRRYETANGLAQDIQRHLKCEPVIARPPSQWYEFQKTVRRHKFGFAAAAAVIVALGLGAIVSTLQAIRATRAETEARAQQVLAGRNADDANAQRVVAQSEAQKAKQEEARANKQASLAGRRLYAAQINLAYQAWEAGDAPRALELLETQRPKAGEEDLRAFEWRHLWGLCHAGLKFTLRGHTGAVNRVAFSPDGKILASAGNEGTVKLWDVGTGQERMTLTGSNGYRGSLAFSPDGTLLVAGGFLGQGIAWDLPTGKQLPVNFPEHSMEGSVAFSPDGRTLAAGNFFGLIKFWDVATWQEKGQIESDSGPVNSLAFTPDGKYLASLALWGDSQAKVWDLTEKPPRLARSFPGKNSAALSPDGATLAVSQQNHQIKLFDLATGAERTNDPGGQGVVFAVAFSPNGKTVAFAAQRRSAAIWNPATGEERIFAHNSAVLSVAFSPGGECFATASEDGIIKLWDLAEQIPAVTSTLKGLRSPVFSPDGATLAFVDSKSNVELFDLVTGQSRTLVENALPQAQLLFSPDGNLLAESAGTYAPIEIGARLHDVRLGRQLTTFRVRNFTFSPDGKTFATADTNRIAKVQLWDLQTMRPFVEVKRVPEGRLIALAFSPDGKLLAGGGQFGWVNTWDATTGDERALLQKAQGATHWLGSLAFAPDGKLLAAGNWDGTVNLWTIGKGQLLMSLKGHTAMVSAMAFFPDGKTLVTASDNRICKFWDVVTGQERLTFKQQSPDRHSLAISPNGTMVATVIATAQGKAIVLRRAAIGP